MNKIILAAGCFWGVQEIFDSTPGVIKTEAGYTGGHIEHPTYEMICSGTTNHAEAVEIQFDSKIISYKQLLKIFWTIHDPTTLNKQGPDIGTQYRSAIFYLDDHQRLEAEESKSEINTKQYNGRVVTEITKHSIFYTAEEYHQHYNKKMKEKYGIS